MNKPLLIVFIVLNVSFNFQLTLSQQKKQGKTTLEKKDKKKLKDINKEEDDLFAEITQERVILKRNPLEHPQFYLRMNDDQISRLNCLMSKKAPYFMGDGDKPCSLAKVIQETKFRKERVWRTVRVNNEEAKIEEREDFDSLYNIYSQIVKHVFESHNRCLEISWHQDFHSNKQQVEIRQKSPDEVDSIL